MIAGTGSGSGAASRTAGSPPAPSGGASDPKTGRGTPNALIQFVSVAGNLLGTGTAQQLLDRLPSLFAANAAATKNYAGHPVPLLRLPDGAFVRFSSTADVQNYLTRSAQPVVPTVTVAATFQSVLGRPAEGSNITAAENDFNAGKSLADYRASLVASPETAITLDSISRQVLNRDATPTELAADKAKLLAGKSMDDVRSDLAHTPEATLKVSGLFQSVLGRDASGADITAREAQLAMGGSLDAVRQSLAVSPEAHDEVAAAFKAELGRDAPDPNVAGMQHMLAAKDGSIDSVRVFLAGTTEAHDEVAAAFKAELGRDAPDPNIAGMQHMLEVRGGSIDGVRAFLAGTVEATGKLNNTFLTVLGRAAQPTETAAMQSMLAQGYTLDDVRAKLALSPEAAAQITVTYQNACGLAPSQDTVRCAQSLAALGVPSASIQSIVTDAAQSATAQAAPGSSPVEQHGLLYYFFNGVWNTATQDIPRDVAAIVTDFINDPTGTAQRLGPTLGGFGAIAGEVPSIVQGLLSGFKLLGAAPSSPATIETERQRLANLIHQRNLGTDGAIGGKFRPSEAATATRLEQVLGRPLSRYTEQGADWVDAYGTTFDAVGPVPPEAFNAQSFTGSIADHLNKQGLDKLVIDMTGALPDQVGSVNAYLSALSPSQAGHIIKLGF